ncbi:hypothetical protein AB0M57_20920 [Streptomyces sp. NPDC051597]|uniref:hypothetical protein n=1 Tax=Streptomyces sp. NPDC051597 TaxID=3155049 RepID=UPI00343D0037
MNFPKPVKLALLLLLAFVLEVLYLHFRSDKGWGGSLLIGVILAPFVVALWKFRDWYTSRARRAGRNWREAREERKRARGV